MATYYIDFASGNDASAGTSEGTAWKTIPGTRNTADNDWESSDWGSGTFNSGSKVPAGTVFQIKPGTTHDSTDGGIILINTTYYDTDATVENPIKFVADQGWASGSVTISGSGMTYTSADALISIYGGVGGIEFDGETTSGFVIQDSAKQGVYANSPGAALVEGLSFGYCKFYNNGTSYSGDQAGASDVRIRNHDGGTIQYCEFNGNDNSINGLNFGESGQRVIDVTVSNCVSHSHYGTDDGGMGFKAFNSQVTYTDNESYDNFKGMDLGEISADAGWTISYTVNRNLLYNNTNTGLGLNNVGGSGAAPASNMYMMNNVLRDNGTGGLNAYAGPFTLYVVHNVFDNNGDGASDYNVKVTSDGGSDTQEIRVYMYNNILYKPGGGCNLSNGYFDDADVDFVLDADYNSYIQKDSEYFCWWSYNFAPNCSFSYGADGPGHASGDWYDYKGCDDAANSTGHEGCDEHSVGTGSAVSTDSPPFTDVDNHDYTLTESYAGTDLSGKGWYIAAMGTDRDGNVRSNWDMGAYEYDGTAPPETGGEGPFAYDLVMILS